MRDSRSRALTLFKIGEKSAAPDIKARAFAVAQIWMTFAIIEDALTMWADQLKKEADAPQ